MALFNYVGKLRAKIVKARWWHVPQQEKQQHDTGSSGEEVSPSPPLHQKSHLASTEAAAWMESALTDQRVPNKWDALSRSV